MTVDSDDKPTPLAVEDRPIDEYANLVTHALGFLLSVAASAFLMTLVIERDETVTILVCGIYCCSLTALYAASTLSHMFYDLAWRRFFRTLDQACIYLLIAGSFTPIAVEYLWERWWSALLAVMWVLALFGVVLVLRTRNLSPLAKTTYGLLGWFPIVALPTLWANAPTKVFAGILAGGFFYSAGTLFLRYDQRIRYFHALWHAFVIAGSTSHYIAILLTVT